MAEFGGTAATLATLYNTALRRCALPWVSVVTPSRFWPLYRELETRHVAMRRSPTADETVQRLRDLLAHACKTVPFYRARASSLGFRPEDLQTIDDLRRLPPTTKADITSHFPDGMLSSHRQFSPWRYAATSGTIERVTVVQDFRKRDLVRVAQLLGLRAATGYRPGMRYVEIPPNVCAYMCGVTGEAEPSWFRYTWQSVRNGTFRTPEVVSNIRGLVERQLFFRRTELPSFPQGSVSAHGEALDWYLERITESRPHVVKALPTYLYLLSLRLLAGGSPKPRISGGLMPMGSSMSRRMKAIAETAFGVPVHEDYGSSELGVFATECGHRNGLHPLSDLFHIEVVRDGAPVAPGVVGKVLVTDLFNYAMPLIRYDIGDVAVVRDGPCPCHAANARLEVLGRIEDCLVADDGQVVTPDDVTDALLSIDGLVMFQVDDRGRDHELDLRVVGDQNATEEAAKALSRLVGPSRKVVARTVTTVLPEGSGKYRLVRNHTNSAAVLL